MPEFDVAEAFATRQPLSPKTSELSLVNEVILQGMRLSKSAGIPLSEILAAGYDLILMAEYYKDVTNTGWGYCPEHSPHLFYPYTNTCPRCIFHGEFHFTPGNKPGSGRIGERTRRLLCVYLQQIFLHLSKPLDVYLGSEPVDVMIHDPQKNCLLLAEVKASPLCTLPLATPTSRLTGKIDEEVMELPHQEIPNTSLSNENIFVLLPRMGDSSSWTIDLIDLGKMESDDSWAYDAFDRLLKGNVHFLKWFVDFWRSAFDAYSIRDTMNSVFWLTNGCGQPSPRPAHWPRRAGSGYESVSDGKTSVGMDRTDDIKKGIYQVLKLGVEGKLNTHEFDVKTALLSNVHAARHYEEYLASLQDIVWTWDPSGTVKKAGDFESDKSIYNLFDGILSFTRNVTRDEWIADNFNFK
ncbi:hypothetical protein [Alicyclobacillus tolerans]|uniref:hypothetical protein n=1 Tax=Alicyclobacillus tolerans TaxID=90970 RepID=UPI00101ADCEC|nr:hypothetical protein [Alicyclobacillus montanus]